MPATRERGALPGRGPVARRARRAGGVVLLTLLPWGAPPPAAEVDPANDARVVEVARKLTCYCGCNTQSVADCACGVARKERAAIQARLDAGETPDQVVAAWVDRFGTRILIEPPPRGFNLLGWLLPSVLLVLSGVVLAALIFRGSRRRPAAASPPPDPRYLEELEHQLRKLEP